MKIECKANGKWTDMVACVNAGNTCGKLVVRNSNQDNCKVGEKRTTAAGELECERKDDTAYDTKISVHCDIGATLQHLCESMFETVF